MYQDSADLQKFYIQKRDQLCKGVLVSTACLYTDSQLNEDLADLKRKKNAKDRQQSDEKEASVSKDGEPSESTQTTPEKASTSDGNVS